MGLVSYVGPLSSLLPGEKARLLARSKSAVAAFETAARKIIEDVKARGDAAVLDYTERFDGVRPGELEVPRGEWDAAARRLPSDVRSALRYAAGNIRRFHEATLPKDARVAIGAGITAGRRFTPLGSVGCYVPGGKAAYPSTLLMTVTPARAAGVRERIVATPPGRDGHVSDATLAAASLAGATRLFAIGGVQAIAALAYGTESVPRVDKIVGPGNNYVNAAKRLLYGEVGLDFLAGPSEVLVIADSMADPRLVAMELLAQAEHDEAAACVLITTSTAHAGVVEAAIVELLKTAPRRAIIEKSLATNGAILVSAGITDAISFANEYAPEHTVIATKRPEAALARLTTSGSVFLWDATVAFGDYATGTNHVLPTAGTARFASGLSTADFMRSTTWQALRGRGRRRVAAAAQALAKVEGLDSHAEAARARLGEAKAKRGRASSAPEAGGGWGARRRR